MKGLTTYAALLRGINVGGNRKVEMKKLRETFERLGLLDVKTYIASGNIIFRTNISDEEKLAKKIETAIQKDFGINDIKVLLRGSGKMSKLVKAIPASWVNDNEMRCDIMFLWKEADKKNVLEELPANPAIEDVKYVQGAILWRIDRAQVTRSKMFKIAGTKLYKQMTIRNANTVRKIYELMLESAKDD